MLFQPQILEAWAAKLVVAKHIVVNLQPHIRAMLPEVDTRSLQKRLAGRLVIGPIARNSQHPWTVVIAARWDHDRPILGADGRARQPSHRSQGVLKKGLSRTALVHCVNYPIQLL